MFIKADLSLVKETDHACAQVKNSEKLVNLVVLSAGEISFDRGRKCDVIPHRGYAPIGFYIFMSLMTGSKIGHPIFRGQDTLGYRAQNDSK